MQLTHNDSIADIFFSLNWKKNAITHRDSYFAHEVNFWQDYFPDAIKKDIFGKAKGYKNKIRRLPTGIIPHYSDSLVKDIKTSQLDMSHVSGADSAPAMRRYYPKGIISDISGIYKQNVTPFRLINKNGTTAKADFNHPLAGIELELDIEICRVEENHRKNGGTSVDWLDLLTTGPGMQARYKDIRTEFFNNKSFEREDAKPDMVFYQKERLVNHIDDMAQRALKKMYGNLLQEDSTVLDLMASWQSHLPEDLKLKKLDGLGLNKKELAANSQLTNFVVHDLNETPFLPYQEGRFDAVICSLSVEYLTQPFAVFKDVARVLKQNGSFIVTFSNRWFPTKAIDVWKQVHEFERLALVTDYFLKGGEFGNIHTVSQRGYPRPYTDAYFPNTKSSDPVYMVSGTRL